MAIHLALSSLLFISLFSISQTLALDSPLTSFSLHTFADNDTASQISLSDDAEIAGGTVKVSRFGRVMYRKPILFLGTDPGFSTNFSFSIASGSGMLFSLHPFNRSESVVSVKYLSQTKFSHIEVDIGSDIFIRSGDLDLSSAERRHCWIEYDGGRKSVEVRVAKAADPWPVNSTVSYQIDLSSVLWSEAMSVDISSWNGNSSGASRFYSWEFVVHHGAPYLMHSEPLDPRSIVVKPRAHIHRRVYRWRIVMAVVFAVVCGFMLVYTVLFVMSMWFERPQIAPVEYTEHDVEYSGQKFVLAGEKGADTTTK